MKYQTAGRDLEKRFQGQEKSVECTNRAGSFVVDDGLLFFNVQNPRKLKENEKYRSETGKSIEVGGMGWGRTRSGEKSEKTNICRNSVRFMEAVSYQSLTLATLPLFLSLLPSLFTFLLAFFFPSEVFHQRASCDGKFPTPSKRLRGRVNANPPTFPEERAVFFIFRLHWQKIFRFQRNGFCLFFFFLHKTPSQSRAIVISE